MTGAMLLFAASTSIADAPASTPDSVYASYMGFDALVDRCQTPVEFSDDGAAVLVTGRPGAGVATGRVDAITGVATPAGRGAAVRDGAGPEALKVEERVVHAGAATVTPQTFQRFIYLSGFVDALEVQSPDHRWFASLRDGNIQLRALADGRNIALTTDGTAQVSWDIETGTQNPWSPDGLRLLAMKVDRTGVTPLPSVHFLKRVEEVSWHPFVLAGGVLDRIEVYIVPVLGKPPLHVDLGDTTDRYIRLLGWRPDGSEVLVARFTRDYGQVDVLAVNAISGAVRLVMSETARTFVRLQHEVLWDGNSGFTWLPDGSGFLWQSERDGWRHLYLYDISGRLLRQLTRGEAYVHDVLRVDQVSGYVYYTASGGPRPYDVHLFRVSLRGSAAAQLTAGEGVHQVRLAPSGAFFVDQYSSVRHPPQAELRRADGQLVAVLEKADITALEARHFAPPEEFTVKAADGRTDLWGVLFRPDVLEPGRKYPLVEYIYGGPFVHNLPTLFCGGGPSSTGSKQSQFLQAIAKTGYVVVVLAARGTPWRSKAFQDVVYKEWADHVVADHAGALRQLISSRPYIDANRVGVFGASWGGYYAFRLLADRPDVYRAAVSISPGFDPYNGNLYEPYLGLPDTNRPVYDAAVPFPLAKKVRGDLMLMGGTSDFATYGDVMRMVRALVDANKHHELVLLPEEGHGFSGRSDDFARSETRRFFDTHLGAPGAAGSPGQ